MGVAPIPPNKAESILLLIFLIMVFLRVALLLLAVTVSSLDGCGSKSSKDNNCSVESNCLAGEEETPSQKGDLVSSKKGDCDWNYECYSNSCGNNNCGEGYLANDDCCAFNNPCGAFDMVTKEKFSCGVGQGDCDWD